jgi:hypothetical protein
MPFLFEGLSASFSASVDKQWKKAFGAAPLLARLSPKHSSDASLSVAFRFSEENRGTVVAPRKRATADYWITSDKEDDDEAEE